MARENAKRDREQESNPVDREEETEKSVGLVQDGQGGDDLQTESDRLDLTDWEDKSFRYSL